MRRQIILTVNFIILAGFQVLNAQDTVNTIPLTLKNVIDLAITQSSDVKYEQNRNISYYWRWQNFRTRFRPQLTLNSNFPIYKHNTEPITQPDGTIKFKQISNLENSAKVSLSQSISQLGTTIYAATSVIRLEDFNQDFVEFSGSPFEIGIWQPLFAYNWMKWSKKTEPLIYEESKRNYIESLEEISLRATYRFFQYLKVQTNYKLAESNLKNSDDNMKIAEVKKSLGTISENDFSRIKLSVYNARKDLNSARIALKNADFELKSYIGLDQSENIELIVPLNMYFFKIDPHRALDEALKNRKESLRSERRLIDADRELVQAKRNNGPRVYINASYGVSNSAPSYMDVYDNTEQQRELELTLSIPILDWGRSASQVKLAESNRDLVVYDVEQDMKDFKRSVIMQVEQFSLLEEQMDAAREADIVAGNGYQIALKKFQNGEISITDLNISLAEREKAKRDYIRSIEDYWVALYNIRILTLYDFAMNQKIGYTNPLLSNN